MIAVPVWASAAGSTVTSAITGQLEGSDGTDFTAGTPVVVWSTPSNDALAAAKVGDSFVDTPIASGVVGSGGAFSVPIDDVSSLEKYASNDGVLTTFSGGGTTITRSSNSANTGTSGADLNAVIGINLSSRTGYTSTAKLSYKNNGSSKKICGTNDYFANSQRSVTK